MTISGKAGTQPKTEEQRASELAVAKHTRGRQSMTRLARIMYTRRESTVLKAAPLSAQQLGGRYSVSGVGDPTPRAADNYGYYIGLLTKADELLDLWLRVTFQLEQVYDRMPSAMVQPDDNARCKGGMHNEDQEGWERPCDRFWDRADGVNAYLCGACIHRKNEWRRYH